MNFFRRLDIEWKVLILAFLMLLMFALPLQNVYMYRLESTLSQSIDPQLEPLLRSYLPHTGDTTGAQIVQCIQRHRQWQAMLPIVIDEQRKTLTILSASLILLLILFSFYSLRRFTRPLKILAGAAQEIGRGATATIKVQSGGALGVLEKSMSQMQQELLRLREKAHAQGMETAWRNIARVMAHEIKNPLTPIRLTLDRLGDKLDKGEAVSQEDLTKSIQRIEVQIAGLERLVNEFRSFAREPETIIRAVTICDSIEPIAEPFKKSLNTKVHGDAIVSADPRLLSQVFLNIWKNAHEAGATTVTVSFEFNGGTTNVVIKDDGPGIPAEHLEKIWIPYVTYKKGGTGIGLPVVKRLLESMGGSVSVVSSTGTHDHGTEFTLQFNSCPVDGIAEQQSIGEVNGIR